MPPKRREKVQLREAILYQLHSKNCTSVDGGIEWNSQGMERADQMPAQETLNSDKMQGQIPSSRRARAKALALRVCQITRAQKFAACTRLEKLSHAPAKISIFPLSFVLSPMERFLATLRLRM